MNRESQQSLVLTVGVESLVGRMRSHNEDSFAVFAPEAESSHRSGLDGLLLVADGMGGQAAGDVASSLAANRIREWADGLRQSGFSSSATDAIEQARDSLTDAFLDTNETIYDYGRKHTEAEGLGSTLVVAAVVGRRLIVAHVGDSRCYRLVDGTVELLTTDHSWVQTQVEAGLLEPDAMSSHPQSNILTRSLGVAKAQEPDVLVLEAEAGQVLVLCSDGMTGSVREEDIVDALRGRSSPQEAAEALAELANERDGSDNITVVVGELQAGAQADDRATAPTLAGAELPSASPGRSRSWLLAVACALALLFGGYYAGIARARAAASTGESIEEAARVLLAKGRRALEADEPVAAREHFQAVQDLFREAEEARDAQRELSKLDRAAVAAVPVVSEEPSGEEGEPDAGTSLPIATEVPVSPDAPAVEPPRVDDEDSPPSEAPEPASPPAESEAAEPPPLGESSRY